MFRHRLSHDNPMRWPNAAVCVALALIAEAPSGEALVANVDVVVGATQPMSFASQRIDLGAFGRLRSKGAWSIGYEPQMMSANVTASSPTGQATSSVPRPVAVILLTNWGDRWSLTAFSNPTMPVGTWARACSGNDAAVSRLAS